SAASSLFLGGDGNLYGSGGVAAFSFTTNGDLRWTNQADFTSPMMEGADGSFYVAGFPTRFGGPLAICSFASTGDTNWTTTLTNVPIINFLLQGSDGNLYGAASWDFSSRNAISGLSNA